MSNAAHDIGAGMHSAIGGMVGIASFAMLQARQERQAAEDQQARFNAVAANARAGVLRNTVAELREDCEDLRDDLALATDINASLQRQVARLTQERDALLTRMRRAA